MRNGSGVTIIVISVLVVLCSCLCIAMLCLGSVAFGIFSNQTTTSPWSWGSKTTTPVVIRPTVQPDKSNSGVVNQLPEQAEELDLEPKVPLDPQLQSQPEILYAPTDTREALENTEIPVNDLVDLAERLGGQQNIPLTVDPPAAPYQVGDTAAFWVTNVDTNENSQVQTVLRFVTDHAYFWIQEGISYDEDDLRSLAETFEYEIYPTNRQFFGSEWSPGVDGDPHLYIIFAQDLGYNLAGYFSSADEHHPLAHEYSNAHETFILNVDNAGLGEIYTYGVLAHEFQHMIQWYQDRNESSWLNEGLSELAAFLNGYDVGGFDYLYTRNTDLQLNDWPNDPRATSPHYGAAFLFVTYFLDRFGESAAQALVSHPANGMESVDEVLASQNTLDLQSGQPVTADDFFLDWAVTNYLLDENISDGRFTYHNYADAPQAEETETIRGCDENMLTRDVRQYGVDYIRITCKGEHTLHFEGSIQTGLLPVDAYSGSYAFWSNKGDESDLTLTRSFDFTGHSGPLTLSYWTWYDLEEDYDYIYLETSTDGETWEILQTPSGTASDPSGNSYGWGYNGLSGGEGQWIQEQVDLSQFSGQEVQIRFEYVTDAAVNGEGLLLDDISVPEIGYFNDFESDSDDWQAAGFVRIQNILPQTYRLALISVGEQTTVEYITLTADNTAEIPISIGGEMDEVILVVSGTTRFTRQPAAYRFQLTP